jgi:hypothetical protein
MLPAGHGVQFVTAPPVEKKPGAQGVQEPLLSNWPGAHVIAVQLTAPVAEVWSSGQGMHAACPD